MTNFILIDAILLCLILIVPLLVELEEHSAQFLRCVLGALRLKHLLH